MMHLIDRKFDEVTQKLTQLVEGQNALILLLLQAKSGNNNSINTSTNDSS